MQQQGQGSGRQKYKKCILRYSGWSHIVKASDIFTDICHQQMIIYKDIPGSSNDDQATSHYASTKGISLLHNKCISKQVL